MIPQITNAALPAMDAHALNQVRDLEQLVLSCPQVEIPTRHVFHGGCYSRTIMIPAGVVLTGALIKIPTTLIVCGHCFVYIGSQSRELKGYQVFPGSANRKQAFVAVSDTWLTMIFPSSAKAVADAEVEFTDEHELLMSNTNDNTVVITGE
jgi:hypothetical protein